MARAAEHADPGLARARRQGPDDRAAPTPTSSAPPTPRRSTRCRTAARPASRSSASTSRRRSTTTSSRAWPRRSARCARASRPRAGTVDDGRDDDPVAGRHRQRSTSRTRRRPARRCWSAATRAPSKGHYYEPTVLVDVDHSMAAMTEETFGPTLPIMKVADADEAVRLANDSPFGLAASVWTKDVARGEEIARRVEAGAVCVNDAQINYLALELPMGGWKTSGMGQRHGAQGIRKYARQQSLLVTRLAPKKDLHMFPYKARTTGHAREGHQAAVRPRQARLARPSARGRARPRLVAVLGARRLLRRPPEPQARGARGAARLAGRRARAAAPVRARARRRDPVRRARSAGRRWRARPASIALGAFYRALAIGTMSVVAPISATGGGGAGARRPRRGRAARARCRSPGMADRAGRRDPRLARARARRGPGAEHRADRAAIGLALVAAAGVRDVLRRHRQGVGDRRGAVGDRGLALHARSCCW